MAGFALILAAPLIHRLGAAQRGSWPPTQPGGWSAASPPAAVTGPSRAAASRNCSPTTGTALRERVLWRMLYETAARAEEILTLNIEDLDPEFRRARVTSKGGAIESTGPAPPACCPGCYAAVTLARSSSLAGERPPRGAVRPPPGTPARPPDGGGCPIRAPSTCSSRRARRSTRTRRAGPCTSCATRPSSTWPPTVAPLPSFRPSPVTSTWPASVATSDSASRPPPASPPKPTRPHAAVPADLAIRRSSFDMDLFGGRPGVSY